MKTVSGIAVMSAEELYGPGPFSGRITIQTIHGKAKILSTDWATILKEPKQMAWVRFGDGSEKLINEDDESLIATIEELWQ